LFAAVGVSLAGSALAQGAEKGCPAGQRPSLSGCVDGSSQARVRLREDASKAASSKPVPKPDPALTAERARTRPLEHQRKTLLIRELAQLEAILARTKESSPDHMSIIRRLAEGYAELESIAERERARAQAAADDLERAARAAEKAPARKSKPRGSGTVM